MSGASRRRYFATEVVQTSSMDCGPAALKSLFSGFSIEISYGRLREACQTDLDGTSIDTLEEVARAGGLDAEQVLVPVDHVMLATASCLPCLAAVRGASGFTHFIVIWRRHGPFVQIMDPARGRLWISTRRLLDQLVVHPMTVPASAWYTWATSDDFLAPLRCRLHRLGLSARQQTAMVRSAVESGEWSALACLDAAARMVESLRRSNALSRRGSHQALTALLDRASSSIDPCSAIPEGYWSAQARSTDQGTLRVRGAVLTRIKGRYECGHLEATIHGRSPELAAAFAERQVRPLSELFGAIRQDGLVLPLTVAAAATATVVGVVFEALLLRSAVDIGQLVQGPGQIVWASLTLIAFALVLLGLELTTSGAERRLGSRLEGRIRMAFLNKLPRLSDAYFSSRPIADMLERSHTLHMLRTFPRLLVRFGRVALELLVTALALVWLNPATAALALIACIAAAAIPLIGQSLIAERDLRTRTHSGALAKFHLDALRGRTALETQGAAQAIENEHELRLADWAASALALQRTSIAVEGMQLVVGFGLAASMLIADLDVHGAAPLLLQAYWMLNLPGLGYELTLIAREYPPLRTTILRMLEPMGAPEVTTGQPAASRSDGAPSHPAPTTLELQKVHVSAAGHTILSDLHLTIAAGQHVAVVGSSGAGKSTFIGLFMGWYRPSEGHVRINQDLLTAESVEQLRRRTAWVEPGVQLWNVSLLENLLYGTGAPPEAAGRILEAAGLVSVVARMPDGLATPLGEGGALLSAGEAQRVRFGRALLKPSPDLVLLDEPFVGLERDRRRLLLSHARQHWSGVTMLYVTHDLPETRGFDRVLVMERGRIVEDGDPRQLAASPSSRYRRLLQAYETTQGRFAANDWRRLRMESGQVTADHTRTGNEQTA